MNEDVMADAATPTDGEALGMLVDEFAADIRRRARAVECLLQPKRPPWNFDPDALPTGDARQLVAIKREVEKTFNAIFSDRPRARARQRGSHPESGAALPLKGKGRAIPQTAA